jgi:hypothetical protein
MPEGYLEETGRLGEEVTALVPVEIAAPAADSPTTIEGNVVNGDFDVEALGRVIDVLDRRR